MNRKLLPIIMILVLLIAIPVQAFANMPERDMDLKYLNIGDSIAVGLSAAPGMSYFELYADYLDDNYGLDETWLLPIPLPGFAVNSRPGAINFSAEGLDSMELLGLLVAIEENEELEELEQYALLREKISQADVITISIGGNNLLTPVIGTVAGLYEVPTSGDFIGNLMATIVGKGPEIWDDNLELFTNFALMSIPEGIDYESIIYDESAFLGWLLEARSAQFLSDWPAILDAIESINPDAQIIAMTLYNPIEEDDNPVLYNRYEEIVGPMNKAIMRTQNRAMVAKVNKAFDKELDAVDFKLTWTKEMPPMPPVLIDPHPTTLGHGIIFEELMKGRSPKSFQ